MTKAEIKKRNKYAPKILIGVPTYEGKNYCLSQFLDNIKNFSYPKDRIEIFFADNSKDNTNALMLNKKYNIKCFWKDYSDMSMFEKMADSHNQIKRYFLDSEAQYLLHLESDVFPPKDVIEQLLWARKPVVNAMYQVFDASHRQPCIKLTNYMHEFSRVFVNHKSLDGCYHWWLEGKPQPVFIGGIGCCLMKRKVMQNFGFRHDTTLTENFPPDSYFAEDLRAKGVKNYVHTGVVCFHWNREDWGRHFEYIDYHKSE
tara:strand:- start:5250 stop:6020 length:771 start_codon:yes stop_codon:yes gene_type:complete